jgi:CubicO group peptidase (beta-lactamase class C family)
MCLHDALEKLQRRGFVPLRSDDRFQNLAVNRSGKAGAVQPSASRPGTQYYYNSADTFLLGPILTRATAMNVAAYCSEKLWVPLGCEQDGFFMLDSDDGMEVLGSCSGAPLRDYGRIGLLMLADGIVNGKRIVPEGWVEQSTRPVAPGFAYDFEGKRPYGAAGPRSRFEATAASGGRTRTEISRLSAPSGSGSMSVQRRSWWS